LGIEPFGVAVARRELGVEPLPQGGLDLGVAPAHVRIGDAVRTEEKEARLVRLDAQLVQPLGGLASEAGEEAPLLPYLLVVRDRAVAIVRRLFLGAFDEGLETGFALVEGRRK